MIRKEMRRHAAHRRRKKQYRPQSNTRILYYNLLKKRRNIEITTNLVDNYVHKLLRLTLKDP